jgi:2',3'-cyclic-nucleotide 2'-phosphodiesterase (5'-nucleotidase family)
VIIGLTHLELYIDQDLSALRSEYPNFLLIAGGHEHTTQIQPLSKDRAHIVKGASNAREIWQITLGRDRLGQPALRDRFIELDESIPEDPAYQAAIETPYRRRLEERIPYVFDRLGSTTARFDATEETVRNGESTWGNFLADQMRLAFDSDEPADVAVLNSGTIRIDDAFSGYIAFEHLLRTFFFSAQIRHVSITGRDLVRYVLEHGVSASNADHTLKPGDGRFLQVSGLRYCFDPDQPTGTRIKMAQIDRDDTWQPIDSTEVYRLAVSDFMYGGGDGYLIKDHSTNATLPGADLKYLALDAITSTDWDGGVIRAEIEGRIINENERPCPE